MFLEALPVVRDIAVVFLVLQWMLFLAVPLFVLIKIVGALRGFMPKVRSTIRLGHDYVRQGQRYVDQVLGYVRAPFVWVNRTLLALSERIRQLESVVASKMEPWRK